MPISFQEAFTHLSELNKAAKSKFSSQNVHIVATEHLSSYGREDDDLALMLRYRKLRNKPLGKSAEKFLEEFAALKDAARSQGSKKP